MQQTSMEPSLQEPKKIAVLVGPGPDAPLGDQIGCVSSNLRLLEELAIPGYQHPGRREYAGNVLVIATVNHSNLFTQRLGGQLHDGLELQVEIGDVDRERAFWLDVPEVEAEGFDGEE